MIKYDTLIEFVEGSMVDGVKVTADKNKLELMCETPASLGNGKIVLYSEEYGSVILPIKDVRLMVQIPVEVEDK